ncbi:tetratricopeptide repeat protein, partial [bacterium]|nr:tetratricopeptide repeat protein [bacterium]
FKKAEEHFKKIIDLSYGMLLIVSNKYRGGAHFHLGCIYRELGEEDKAKQHFEECLRLIPNHKKAKEYLEILTNEL